jgi:DNA-binding transcriptional LysR family regulator
VGRGRRPQRAPSAAPAAARRGVRERGSWKIKRPEQRAGRPLLIWDGVGADRLAALLGTFSRHHPAAPVELRVDHTESLARDVDAGVIDVAVIQVTDDDLRRDDDVLWSDDLRWVTCSGAPFDGGTVPLVTFGEHCFYRSSSEPVLTAHGVPYTVAFALPSITAVRAAVGAGLGVAVVGSRHFGGVVVEWARGAALGPLSRVHQVARAVPGEQAGVAAALKATLVEQLTEPSAAAAAIA